MDGSKYNYSVISISYGGEGKKPTHPPTAKDRKERKQKNHTAKKARKKNRKG